MDLLPHSSCGGYPNTRFEGELGLVRYAHAGRNEMLGLECWVWIDSGAGS
jgi:hypothetical protein